MTYKFDEIINGLEKFMEKEYLNSEDGNSFFFTGGQLILKDIK